MKQPITVTLLALACFTVSGQAADTPKVLSAEPSAVSRAVDFSSSVITPLHCQLQYVTMIQLDKAEEIMGITCGDCGKDDAGGWNAEYRANFVFITPKKQGVKTNLNIVTKKGNIYTFTLHEISGVPDAHADLRIRVNTTDPEMFKTMQGPALFASADEVKRAEERADSAEAKLLQVSYAAKANAVQDVEKSIRHGYHWEQNEKAKKTFGIRQIYELNGFTYIEATPQELPSFYEVKDEKPSLVNAEFRDGRFVIPKVIEQGELVVGKSKLTFKRES